MLLSLEKPPGNLKQEHVLQSIQAEPGKGTPGADQGGTN